MGTMGELQVGASWQGGLLGGSSIHARATF